MVRKGKKGLRGLGEDGDLVIKSGIKVGLPGLSFVPTSYNLSGRQCARSEESGD